MRFDVNRLIARLEGFRFVEFLMIGKAWVFVGGAKENNQSLCLLPPIRSYKYVFEKSYSTLVESNYYYFYINFFFWVHDWEEMIQVELNRR